MGVSPLVSAPLPVRPAPGAGKEGRRRRPAAAGSGTLPDLPAPPFAHVTLRASGGRGRFLLGGLLCLTIGNLAQAGAQGCGALGRQTQPRGGFPPTMTTVAVAATRDHAAGRTAENGSRAAAAASPAPVGAAGLAAGTPAGTPTDAPDGTLTDTPAGSAGARPAPFTVELLPVGPAEVSLRGLAIAPDGSVWVTGTGGTLGRSSDGGHRWQWSVAPGLAARDLRDVEAFDHQRALLLAVGAPGLLLATADGGATVGEVLRDDHPAAFFDAMAFVGAHGLLFGDPRPSANPADSTLRFPLWATADGGTSWQPLAGPGTPTAVDGEAAFAASGTALALLPGGDATPRVLLATGGTRTRIWRSADGGQSFSETQPPLASGAPSRGVFSLAADGTRVVAVGGDFQAETVRAGTAAWSDDDGRSWHTPSELPGGYRSVVVALGGGRFLASGPTGTDLSLDGGDTWALVSAPGFHTATERDGQVFLAGSAGRLARLCGGDLVCRPLAAAPETKKRPNRRFRRFGR